MDCFSILLSKKQTEAKADRMLTIKLPAQSNVVDPNLKSDTVASPEVQLIKKKQLQAAVKKELLLPQLSLILDKHSRHISSHFRPSHKRAKLAEKVKWKPQLFSAYLVRVDDSAVHIRPQSPVTSMSNIANSPVVCLRRKSPLAPFRQAYPMQHGGARSMKEHRYLNLF